MERCIKELRDKLPRKDALSIYRLINRLSPARFATRRLHLPCIVFSVRSLEKPCEGNGKLYRAQVSGLGQVEFTTADDLSLNEPRKFVFAHPWIRHIRGPSITPMHPAPQVGNYTRALEMVARLGQPFSALLLVQEPNGEYKRVAAENEIVVPGLGTDITSKNIRAKVLEIL
ncbi:hypothetical protein M404DRAFT_153134 [Pisolithus tinctorius Marx 270]|uniref:Uncharacterized protein n=1 Tax=Pisolithus tinctorius Marx 270 TaxID=870435 RepID=A0A0C3NYV9_PISTI|nr:hypothetical protein M404DRAFT_153134 [Pisolithus tinctorius Marx 270]